MFDLRIRGRYAHFGKSEQGSLTSALKVVSSSLHASSEITNDKINRPLGSLIRSQPDWLLTFTDQLENSEPKISLHCDAASIN
jgi:hypothetical protein